MSIDYSYGIFHLPTGLWVTDTIAITDFGEGAYLGTKPKAFQLDEASSHSFGVYHQNQQPRWEPCNEADFVIIKLHSLATFLGASLTCNYIEVEEYYN